MRSACFAAASPGLAAKFDSAVQDAEVFSAEFTEMRMPYKYGTRRVITGKFKFLIVYPTRQDEIVVIAMAPFKRKQGYWRSPSVGLRSSRHTLSVGRSRLRAEVQQWLLCRRSVPGRNPKGSAAPPLTLGTWRRSWLSLPNLCTALIVLCTNACGTDGYNVSKDNPLELIDGGGLFSLFREHAGMHARIAS